MTERRREGSFAPDAYPIFTPLGEQLIFDDTRSWVSPDGYRLSDRLWRARVADRAAIDAILRRGLASGTPVLEMARTLEQFLMPGGRVSRTRYPTGSGSGNASARRLARTETTRAFGVASTTANRENPFVQGMKWNLSGTHRGDDVCNANATGHSAGMGPGEYTFDEFPTYPGHPMCRCFETPVTVDDVDAVLATLAPAPQPTPVVLEAPPPNAPFRPATTIKAAEEYARSLGIDNVTYRITGKRMTPRIAERHLPATNTLNAALAEFKARGLPLPKTVRVTRDPYAKAIAYYSPKDESVTVNILDSFWANPTTSLAEQQKTGWFVATRSEDLIIHELGHFLHLRGRPLADVRAFGDANKPGSFRALGADVSRYATTSESEFVAEVFVVLFRGGSVSEEALAYYQRLGGVVP